MGKKPFLQHDVCIIGAGGTGSYFLKEVSRYIAGLPKEKKKRIRNMYIIDGDYVEKKNLNRQAFMTEDIGRKKAAVMTEVLNEAFGLEYKCIDRYLENLDDFPALSDKKEYSYHNIPVLIGCVDNHACRLLCEEFFNKAENCIYFDSANEFVDGECIFSAKIDGEVKAPTRSYYFPNMLQGDLRKVTELSCEEMNASSPQHIFTNMYASLQLLSAFMHLIENEVILKGWSYFDTTFLANQFTPYRPVQKKEETDTYGNNGKESGGTSGHMEVDESARQL